MNLRFVGKIVKGVHAGALFTDEKRKKFFVLFFFHTYMFMYDGNLKLTHY